MLLKALKPRTEDDLKLDPAPGAISALEIGFAKGSSAEDEKGGITFNSHLNIMGFAIDNPIRLPGQLQPKPIFSR